MTAQRPLNLDAAAAFLARSSPLRGEAFREALISEIRSEGGIASVAPARVSETLFPAACEFSLHGIRAYGADPDQTARNWRMIAARLVDPKGRLSLQDAQMLAWSIEAMSLPEIIADDTLLRRACKTILRLEPGANHALRARATELLRSIDRAPEVTAAASHSSR